MADSNDGNAGCGCVVLAALAAAVWAVWKFVVPWCQSNSTMLVNVLVKTGIGIAVAVVLIFALKLAIRFRRRMKLAEENDLEPQLAQIGLDFVERRVGQLSEMAPSAVKEARRCLDTIDAALKEIKSS